MRGSCGIASVGTDGVRLRCHFVPCNDGSIEASLATIGAFLASWNVITIGEPLPTRRSEANALAICGLHDHQRHHESLNYLTPGDVCYSRPERPRQLNKRKKTTFTIPWKMYYATMNAVRAIAEREAPNVEYDSGDSLWFQVTTNQFCA
jgi:hypothetical protein